MNIVLKSLDLVHFKCFPKLHLDFHEGVNNIYGENAAGKTSVYDSLTWLLFNKDSAGNARPDIKPHGAPQGTMPEVTAILIVDGEPIKLTPIEYNILLLLVKNAGKVFSIDQIYEKIWNEDAIGADNTVAVHIRHIREKIEINPKEPRYLKVVWGVGYKIDKN